MASKKKGIDLLEFRGGYAVVRRAELEAIMDAHRERRLGKDRMRVFAAMLEQRALHERSTVDMHRIVNAQHTVARRLRPSQVERLEGECRELLSAVPQSGKRVIVSREMLRYIARGRASCSEAVVLLCYCMRRKRQDPKRPMGSLRDGERYARFRYSWLAELSGCGRSTLCRAVARLRRCGLLQTRPIQKWSEDRHGCVFADGSHVTLTPQAGRKPHRVAEMATPPVDSDNAPRSFSTTQKNVDPKTSIQNREGDQLALVERDGVLVVTRKGGSMDGGVSRKMRTRRASTGRSRCPEFLRIQERARQMRESFSDPVA
jgi:hypothetical protein